MKGNYQKFTRIEELPELQQIEPMQQSVAQPEYATSQGDVHPKLQRFIRPQSHGMPMTNLPVEFYEQAPGHFETEDMAYSGNPPGAYDLSQGYRSKQVPINVSPPAMKSNMEPYEPDHSHYNCRDLYGHVKECDICKRFYKSDSTVYLVIIAILLVACALLAKKVMNI